MNCKNIISPVMIRKFFLFLALCGCIPTAAQKITERPSFEVRTSAVTTIEKIEQTDDCTRLYVHAVSRPRTWIIQNRQTYLEDAATGKRYEPTGAEGITLDKRVFFPRSGELRYVVIYPPLPNGVKTLNWIEPGADGWKTYGISLEEADATSRREDAFRGNWLLDGRYKQWVLGVYDSVAVYDNRLWKLTQLKAGKKSCRVHLVSGDDEKKLTLRLLGDGRCRIDDGKEKLLCSREGSSVRNYGGTADALHASQPGDTVCVQGYIDGYDRRLDYATGIFYLDNEYTGEDFPVVIDIRPDGTFCSRFPLAYARQTYLLVNGARCPMFLEPGQTHTLYLNHEDLLAGARLRGMSSGQKKILYMGPAAAYSRQMDEQAEMSYFGSPTERDVNTLTPDAFKARENVLLAEQLRRADSIVTADRYNPRSARMLKNAIRMQYGINLIGFSKERFYALRRNPENPVLRVKEDSTYYDFLKDIPLDSEELTACDNFSTFINRFEFMAPLSFSLFYTSGRDLAEKRIQHWTDSCRLWLKNVTGQDYPLVLQIKELRNIRHDVSDGIAEDALQLYAAYAEKSFTCPVIKDYFRRMMEEAVTSPLSAYDLPEGRGTDIIRRIVDPYKGKYVLVDFWATSCGPCRAEIEGSLKLRERYRNSPDIQFVFVTNDEESPSSPYKDYVAKHLKGETVHRIPASDYHYLRQLFRFNGIPYYVTFDRNGRVLRKTFDYYSLDSQLEEALKCEREAK